jgi:hypothetical protein
MQLGSTYLSFGDGQCVLQKLFFSHLLASSQEEILGISTTQIHYVYTEIRKSSLICNLHGFGKIELVDEDILSEIFYSCFG